MASLETLLTYLTLISVPIGVFYHIMTLNNTRKNQQMQLDTRQAQLLMQIYQSRYNQVGIKQFWKILLLQWDDFEDYMKKYGPYDNPEVTDELALITSEWNYFDGLGILLQDGLLNENNVYRMMGIRSIMIWYKCETLIQNIRSMEGGTGEDYLEGFEFLANKMIDIRKSKGVALPTNWIHPTSELFKNPNP